MISIRRFSLSLCAVFSISAGCSYKPGYPNPFAGEVALRVRNESFAPLLGPRVERELRKRMLRSGKISFSENESKSQLTLHVTLRSFSDQTESYRREDSLLAAGYALRISADLRLENAEGKVLLEREASGRSSIALPASDQPFSDDAAMQALAESISSEISLSLSGVDW